MIDRTTRNLRRSERLAESDRVPHELRSSAAVKAADVLLAMEDIDLVCNALAILRDSYPEKPERGDQAIAAALFRDSIIQLVECFKRTLDPKVSLAGVDGGMEFLEALTDLRNTHAAHSVGPTRQCAVGLSGSEPPHETLVFVRMTHITDPPHELGGLIRFAETTYELLRARLGSLEKEILEEVAQMTSAEISALPPAQLVSAELEHLHLGRKAYARTLRGDPPPLHGDRAARGKR